uniref:Transposase n=1 Tax=Bosea sp. NBC_00436 TaxID=2969620 RepID=A0A9E7ZXL6_9HYPH
MAKVAGLAICTIQKIWKAHGFTPHRRRQFKLSTDPAFAEKLHDVASGLYVGTVRDFVFCRKTEM